jgi:hypothetical protein
MVITAASPTSDEIKSPPLRIPPTTTFYSVEEFSAFIQSENNKSSNLTLNFAMPKNLPGNFKLESIIKIGEGEDIAITIIYKDPHYIYNEKLDERENMRMSSAMYTIGAREVEDKELFIKERKEDRFFTPLYLDDMLVFYLHEYSLSDENVFLAHFFDFLYDGKHMLAYLPSIDGINEKTFKDFLSFVSITEYQAIRAAETTSASTPANPATTTAATESTAQPVTTPEQIEENYSYTFTIASALDILKHLAKLDTLTAEQAKMYDFYGTGTPTINDALEILKHLAKLPSLIG